MRQLHARNASHSGETEERDTCRIVDSMLCCRTIASRIHCIDSSKRTEPQSPATHSTKQNVGCVSSRFIRNFVAQIEIEKTMKIFETERRTVRPRKRIRLVSFGARCCFAAWDPFVRRCRRIIRRLSLELWHRIHHSCRCISSGLHARGPRDTNAGGNEKQNDGMCV